MPHDASAPSRPRYRGGATTYAEEHRAHARVERPRRVLTEAAVIGIVTTALWIALIPLVSRLWGHILATVAPGLGAAGVRMALTDAWGVVTIGIPFLDLSMGVPGPVALFASGFGILVLWIGSIFLPERWRPGVYLLRAVLLVHASAVVYFALWPELFPYTLADYLHGMTATGLAIATATPVVLALALHVQDLSIGRKVGFTALALAYSVVLVPVQYAVQGWILSHATALVMPALYLFGGVPLHVFALVALYAWAMSWPGRLPALGVPDTDSAPLPTPVDLDRAPLPSHDIPVYDEPDPEDLVPDATEAAMAAMRTSALDLFDLGALDGAQALARPVLFSTGGDGQSVTGLLDLPPNGPPLAMPEWTPLADIATPSDTDLERGATASPVTR